MKTEGRLHIRFADADRELLEALSKSLGLDLSSTVRLMLHEKCLERGIIDPPKPGKKKRRASG